MRHVVGLVGLVACSSGEPDVEAWAESLVIEPAIFFGSPAVAAADRAIVAVGNPQVGVICTGTLVKRDLVLTAAHCLDGVPGTLYAIFLDRVVAPTARDVVRVQSAQMHPQYDPRTLEFDAGALTLVRAAPFGITPIPPTTPAFPLPRPATGAQGEIVGFGEDETGASGAREEATMTVVAESSDHLVLDSNTSGACFGDSGGPFLLAVNGQTRVAGVISAVLPSANPGQHPCAGETLIQRADVVLPWLLTL